MQIKTMYLPGFSYLLKGRRPKSEVSRVMEQATKLDGLAALVARFIPTETFKVEGERKRLFTAMVTFTAFLGQVLHRGSSCREAVRRVQAWFLATGQTPPDDNTSAYCQARSRLGIDVLRKAHDRLCQWFVDRTKAGDLWLGRSVKVVDCTGISMADTVSNRKRFPYAGGQRTGCGFPTGKLVGLFSLATGHLHRFAFDSWKTHDVPLMRRLIGWINEGEILLGDRGFCGWGLIALLARKKVDVVLRVHQARQVKGALMHWAKPQCLAGWDRALWAELPDRVTVRIVRYRVETPGFRTKEVVLATTLLDSQKYPDAAIMELFGRRWQVELNFRDIKTSLGLDVLRAKSAALVQKEIFMQVIAYNIVRGVMLQSAHQHQEALYRLSFKGTVATLRQWTFLFGRAPDAKTLSSRFEDILLALASDLVPHRPNRIEPRAVKRRPKVYQRLTAPRHEMVVSPSRRQK
jgi:hypothetical protein